MDVCTSLVQAYLHVNGYFTTTDYPLVEERLHNSPRTLTDMDTLAVRLGVHESHSDHAPKPRVSGPLVAQADPQLAIPPGSADMIVAEIKQGRARINPAARKRNALGGALARFGCCQVNEAADLVRDLLEHGRARSSRGHSIRMVLFASQGERAPRAWHWVRLDHVFRFLDDYLTHEQNRLGHVDLHDPTLAWLTMLHKCGLSLTTAETES